MTGEPKWTEAEDRKLMILWNRGVALRFMIFEMDRTYSAIKKRRAALGLSKRKGVSLTDNQLRVNVDESTYDAIKQRAATRGSTVAEYLRMLINRDLGKER